MFAGSLRRLFGLRFEMTYLVIGVKVTQLANFGDERFVRLDLHAQNLLNEVAHYLSLDRCGSRPISIFNTSVPTNSI